MIPGYFFHRKVKNQEIQTVFRSSFLCSSSHLSQTIASANGVRLTLNVNPLKKGWGRRGGGGAGGRLLYSHCRLFFLLLFLLFKIGWGGSPRSTTGLDLHSICNCVIKLYKQRGKRNLTQISHLKRILLAQNQSPLCHRSCVSKIGLFGAI